MPDTPPADWYEDAFGDLYTVLYAHRSVEAAAPEAAFAAQVLGLEPADRLLDLCCGGGRHLVHLSKIVRFAAGLDYSRALLQEGRGLLGASGRLVRADMRAVPFHAAFDAVTNFFTSFGYFQDCAENMQVIRDTANALKPGGRFFIDYVNPAYVRDTLDAESERTIGAYQIHECRWIDDETKRVNKVMRVQRDGKTIATLGESVRLYEEPELRALLEGEGLVCEAIFGNYNGVPLARHEPRMIVAGRKCR
jgi:SAM-dependent methyltransferase